MPQTRQQRRKSKKTEFIVDFEQLGRIVDTTCAERALTGEEQKALQDAHLLLLKLALPPFRNDESSESVLGESGREKLESSPEPKKGHGRKSRDDFKKARVVAVAHPDYKHGDICPCGCGGRLYRLSRALHFRHFVGQAPIQITLYEREQLRSNRCEQVFTAPLPHGVGPEPYHETAVSTIALSKYGLGLPFYRQALFLASMGTPIAAATQYEIVADAFEKLKPLLEHLVDLGAQGKVLHLDDASVKILDLERSPDDERTGIFTTGCISKHEMFEIALFFTGIKHAGENRVTLMKSRDPKLPALIQMSDALAANLIEFESSGALLSLCLCHGRRNFVQIVESFPNDCRRVLEAIGTVYHHDSESKKLNHTDEQRLAYHQEKSEPIMGELREWLDKQFADKNVEPNSTLGKAIQYLLTHWEGLTLFLRVPGAPLDNNVVERSLKKVILHRKNSLFFRTAKGAKVSDLYMSLIQTCQLNGANPYDYLTETLRNWRTLKENPGDWLPWTYEATLKKNEVVLAQSQEPAELVSVVKEGG